MVGYNFKSNDIYAEAFALDAKCLAMYNQGNLQACVFCFTGLPTTSLRDGLVFYC